VAKSSKRPLTAQEAVFVEIRRSILAGEMPPGTQIFQEDLATEYGVSRIPVRDALRLLEGEGLVSYAPHHGYQVTRLTEEELLELQRLREVLEDEAIRVGATKITAQALATMNAALIEMHEHEQIDDLASWAVAHRRFHFALYDCAGMPSLTRILGQAWDASDLYRSRYLRTRPGLRSASASHRPILAAARDKNPEPLLTLMAQHRGTIMGWLKSPDASGPPLRH
jgi:DNA-binding GntR family transcriptional regulator